MRFLNQLQTNNRSRIQLAVAAAAMTAFFASSDSNVWGQNQSPIQPARTLNLTTKDKISLACTYWASNAGREAPVVVFLHREGGDRLEWPQALTSGLQRNGYAVMTVDLRGHGQSKVLADDNQQRGRNNRNRVKLIPQDYKNIVNFDMEAIKEFIYEEHQESRLNMNKMGIVGAEMGAAIAVSYAMVDWMKEPHPDGVGADRTPRGQDVRSLVLLSPVRVAGLPYPQPINVINNPEAAIWFMVGVSKQDRDGLRESEKIYEMFNKFGKNQGRCLMREYPGGLKGADMLTRPELKVGDDITAFLEESLKKLPANWRDRRSKITGR